MKNLEIKDVNVGDTIICKEDFNYFTINYVKGQELIITDFEDDGDIEVIQSSGIYASLSSECLKYFELKKALSYGVGLISDERKRQVEKEGWTAEHDILHDRYELSKAAVQYILFAIDPMLCRLINIWPWAKKWWKPMKHDKIRNLVKAGALIAAEIDRLKNKEK